MSNSSKLKVRSMCNKHPLNDNNLLQTILRFVGAGEGLCLMLVSQRWEKSYFDIPLHPVTRQKTSVTYCHRTTLGSAAFSSRNRLLWALAGNFDMAGANPFTVGLCSSIDTLETVFNLNKCIKTPLEQDLLYCQQIGEGIVCSGSVTKLEWILERNLTMERDLCYEACRSGQTGILGCLLDRGVPLEDSHIEGAAFMGHLDTVQYLHSRGSALSKHISFFAASSGHVPLVEWLHQNGCPWDEDVCAKAASEGHLSVHRIQTNY
jgi:hypothetical protein